MNKHNIEVGQKLYYNDSTRINSTQIEEVEITRVAKKYCYYNKWGREKPITLENLKHENENYSQSNIQFYLDKQDILDEWEKKDLSKYIRDKIGQYGIINLPIADLRQIKIIVDNNNEK